jgi:hypothetical protein
VNLEALNKEKKTKYNWSYRNTERRDQSPQDRSEIDLSGVFLSKLPMRPSHSPKLQCVNELFQVPANPAAAVRVGHGCPLFRMPSQCNVCPYRLCFVLCSAPVSLSSRIAAPYQKRLSATYSAASEAGQSDASASRAGETTCHRARSEPGAPTWSPGRAPPS